MKRRVAHLAVGVVTVFGLLMLGVAARADGVLPTAAVAVPTFVGVTLAWWGALDTIPPWARRIIAKLLGPDGTATES